MRGLSNKKIAHLKLKCKLNLIKQIQTLENKNFNKKDLNEIKDSDFWWENWYIEKYLPQYDKKVKELEKLCSRHPNLSNSMEKGHDNEFRQFDQLKLSYKENLQSLLNSC